MGLLDIVENVLNHVSSGYGLANLLVRLALAQEVLKHHHEHDRDLKNLL